MLGKKIIYLCLFLFEKSLPFQEGLPYDGDISPQQSAQKNLKGALMMKRGKKI